MGKRYSEGETVRLKVAGAVLTVVERLKGGYYKVRDATDRLMIVPETDIEKATNASADAPAN